MKLAAVARANGLSLAMADVFQTSILAQLSLRLESPNYTNHLTIDWEKETVLDEGLPRAIAGANSDRKPISVVLTGSTGFLGRELLRQLIENPWIASVHCLAVRPGRTLPGILSGSNKVFLHPGDLAAPRLGLSEMEADKIFSSIAAIIHNGSEVSFLKSYTTLHAANVASTRQLLELALHSAQNHSEGFKRTPSFHYVSTAGVGQLLRSNSFSETSLAAFPPPTDGFSGYTATKWASERVLERAADSLGVRVTIHRPSNITGLNVGDRDIVHNIWKFAHKLRAVPDLVAAGAQGAFDFVAVETCGASIIRSVLNRPQSQLDTHEVKYVHESGDTVIPFDMFGTFLAKEIGDKEISVLPLLEWVERATKSGLDELIATFLRQTNGAFQMPLLVKREERREQ